MVFNSLTFLLFFVVFINLYWLISRKLSLQFRNIFILLSSYLFYGWWDWRFLGLIIISTGADYLIGMRIGKVKSVSTRKSLLALSIFINLGILGFFKYFNFFIDSLNELLLLFSAPISTGTLNIILPVGISFYTIQSMSYTIDIFRNKIQPTRDPFAFFAFVAFFPQLVAGPIERAGHLLPQFLKQHSFSYSRSVSGLQLVLWGLFKKIVIADNFGVLVEQLFDPAQPASAIATLAGGLFFTLQIYADFSGYSDIAIGIARMLGFDLMQNFRTPFFSASLQEFWQRWHISLIRWNRDYLYIPLGGSRVGFLRHKFNIFLTMFAAGVWHGANWTYTIWGAIHGLILAVESSVRDLARNRSQMKNVQKEAQNAARIEHEAHPEVRYFSKRWPIDILKLALTSFVTIFFGTMFRSRNISESWLIMKRMLCLEACSADFSAATYAYPVLWAAGFIAAGHVLGYWLFEKGRLRWRIPLWVEIGAGAVLTVVCIQFSASGSPFIYFVF